jgi:hypothetical protein
MAGRRKVLATAATGLLALALAAASLAHDQVVSDPAERGLQARADIEWAAVDHPVTEPWRRLVRHTIKTRAPYGPARTPWLYLRVRRSDRPAKYHRYVLHGTGMNGPDGPTTISRVEKPVADPDTVSYTFDLSQIGNPPEYEWRAESPSPLEVDRVPDEGWAEHKVAP